MESDNSNLKRLQIAERLKKARELSGLSQAQVALKLNVQRPAISEIEAGRRKVLGCLTKIITQKLLKES